MVGEEIKLIAGTCLPLRANSPKCPEDSAVPVRIHGQVHDLLHHPLEEQHWQNL